MESSRAWKPAEPTAHTLAEQAVPSTLHLLQVDESVVGAGVNLFHGQLTLPIHLMTLYGGSGLACELSLLYRSDMVHIDTWAPEAPASPVGNGWSLPYDRIERAVPVQAHARANEYLLWRQGQCYQLSPLAAGWPRGTVPRDADRPLRDGALPAALAEAFARNGWALSPETRIEAGSERGVWLVHDSGQQRSFLLTPSADGAWQVRSGGQSFESQPFAYWQVTYYPPYNRWEMVLSDGTLLSYGGIGEESATAHLVQWGVRWANWSGPALFPTLQERFPIAWNLGRIENTVGNWIAFAYAVDERTVEPGGARYTRACRLQRLVTDLGWACALHYEPMIYDASSLDAPKEYLDPHHDPTVIPGNTGNAWQSRYETHYLQRITCEDASGPGATLELDYYPLQNLSVRSPTNPLGYGATYRRYLKSITEHFPFGHGRPGVTFEYHFSPDTPVKRGALSHIVYPTGAISTFLYSTLTVNGRGAGRDCVVRNPFGEQSSTPVRVWTGTDQVLCAWYNQALGQLRVTIHTWIGQWVSAQPAGFHFNGALDLDALYASLSEHSILLALPSRLGDSTQVALWQRSATAQAHWTLGALTETARPLTYAGRIEVMSGHDVFLVTYDSRTAIDRLAFDPRTMHWERTSALSVESAVALGAGAGSTLYAAAHAQHYLIIACSPQTRTLRMALVYRDPLQRWHDGGRLETPLPRLAEIEGEPALRLTLSDSCGALAYLTEVVTAATGHQTFNYTLQVMSWDDQYQTLTSASLPAAPASDEGFQRLPMSLLAWIWPVIVANTTIGSGPNLLRFHGVSWRYEYLGRHFRTTNSTDPAFAYAYGLDAVAQTESTPEGLHSTLKSLDRDASRVRWDTQVLEERLVSRTGWEHLGLPDLTGPWLLQGTNAYGRSVWPDWGQVSRFALDTLPGTGIDPLTTLGQERFIAYARTHEDGTISTEVIRHHNGDLQRDAQGRLLIERLAGERLMLPVAFTERRRARDAGLIPVATATLVTVPAAVGFDGAAHVTLHRLVQGSSTGALSFSVVSGVHTDSGYDRLRKCYVYDTEQALSNANGTLPQFAHATEYPATETPDTPRFGQTVWRFLHGMPPTDPVPADHPQACYSATAGLLLSKAVFDATGRGVQATQSVWTVAREVATDPAGRSLRPTLWPIPRLTTARSQLDGVEEEVDFTYDPASGAVAQAHTQYFGSTGKPIAVEQLSLFAFQVYPELWARFILVPVAQSETRIKGDDESDWTRQACKVLTSRFWRRHDGTGYWGEEAGWVPVSPEAGPFDWHADVPPRGWQRTQAIQERGSHGQVLRSTDLEGRAQVTLWDEQGRLPIASFLNAASGVSYDSFEDYQPTRWRFQGISGHRLEGDANTGRRCYEIRRAGVLSKKLDIPDGATAYVFSAWVKTRSGVVAGLEVALSLVHQRSGRSVRHRFEPTGGAWQNVQWVMVPAPESAGPQTITLQVHLTTDASQPESYLRVDDIVFVPLTASFAAEVYEAAKLRAVASLGLNGLVQRRVYNRYGQVSGLVNPSGAPVALATAFYTRQMAEVDSTHPFPTTQPNAALQLTARGGGFYDLFYDDALDNYRVVEGTRADWAVRDGALHMLGQSRAPLGARLQRSDFVCDSLAVGVEVVTAPTHGVSLGTGRYFVTWDGAQWLLQLQDSESLVTLQTVAGSPASAWLLAVFDIRLLFFADGRQIFSYTSEAIAQQPHGVQLAMQQPGAFRDLVALQSISLRLDFLDGLLRPQQSIAMESGTAVIMGATLYEAMGTPAIQVKPTRVVQDEQVANPFAYLTGYITNGGEAGSVWQGAPLSGAVTERYHPGDGYPFTRVVPEASALLRPVQLGQPGQEFAIRPGNTHVASIAYGANTHEGAFLRPLPVGKYHMVTETDADGTPVTTWSDVAGNRLGTVIPTSSRMTDTQAWRTCIVRDARANPTMVVPPTAFTTPIAPGSVPPGTSTAVYNGLGQCVQITDPDSGRSRCIYTRSSRIRFLQDAAGEAGGYFLYTKYDALGRPVEQGTYPGAWDAERLQALADQDPTWPSAEDTWETRYVYDGDESTPLMAGRLWKALVNNLGGREPDVIEVYAYDIEGRVTMITRQVSTPAMTAVCTFQHTYDTAGLIRTTHDSVTGVTSHMAYDALGRLIEIAAVLADGSRVLLASYRYRPDGGLQTSTLLPTLDRALLQRDYDYNDAGWLTRLDDAQFAQQLSYTRGGVRNAGYWDGALAAERTRSLPRNGLDHTSEQAYQVDALGQIVEAVGSSRNLRWTFDPNGNVQQRTDTGNAPSAWLFRYIEGGGNQLLAVDGARDRQWLGFDYDARGAVRSQSMQGQPVQSLTYTPTGYIRRIDRPRDPAARVITYLRAPGSVRTLKSVQGNAGYHEFRMAMSGDEVTVTERQGQRTLMRQIAAPDVQLLYVDGQLYFGLCDHLGSMRLIVDTAGKVVAQYDYDLYGAPVIQRESPFPYTRLYTGHLYEAEAGLYDGNARLYHPGIGRFLSVDPGYESPSPYVYVGNNPAIATDPTGMWTWRGVTFVVGLTAVSVATLGVAPTIGIGVTLALGTIGAVVLGPGIIPGSVAGGVAAATALAVTTGSTGGLLPAVVYGIGGSLVGGLLGQGFARVAWWLGQRSTRFGFRGRSIMLGTTLVALFAGGTTGIILATRVFGASSTLNIAVALVAGAGAGAMGSTAYMGWLTPSTANPLLPIALTNPALIQGNSAYALATLHLGDGGAFVNSLPLHGHVPVNVQILTTNDPTFQHVIQTWINMAVINRRAWIQNLTTIPGIGPVDVVATHGVTGRILVEWQDPSTGLRYNRPVSASTLAAFLRTQGYGARPIKLVVCFAAMGWEIYSFAQSLATEMSVDVYAHWWIVYPTAPPQYRRFRP